MSKRKQVQVPIEKIQEQDRFIEAIAEKNSRFYAIHQTKPKYMIQTFGCQMNEHDSENIAGIMEDMSYTRIDDMDMADVISPSAILINATEKSKKVKIFFNLISGKSVILGAEPVAITSLS